MQFNTKLGLVDIPNDDVMAASRDIAGSAVATCEPAGPLGALGVARGCLEVSSAEVLLLRWHLEAEAMDKHAKHWEGTSEPTIAALCRGTADGLRKCLQELRREMGLPYPRQPQDNK